MGEGSVAGGTICSFIRTAWGKNCHSTCSGSNVSVIPFQMAGRKTGCRRGDGVSWDAWDSSNAALVVNLQQEREMGANNLPCCFHYPVLLLLFGPFCNYQKVIQYVPYKGSWLLGWGDLIPLFSVVWFEEVKSSDRNTSKNVVLLKLSTVLLLYRWDSHCGLWQWNRGLAGWTVGGQDIALCWADTHWDGVIWLPPQQPHC